MRLFIPQRCLVALVPLLFALPLSGCHSKYVEADIVNHTSDSLNVVQVDYPSASFGTQALKPGATFHYRFKLLGSGPIKITYTDATNTERHQTGPHLDEGQEGTLQIVFAEKDKATFTTNLHP